jgi:DNA-binding beta-propeller fold protein YncE
VSVLHHLGYIELPAHLKPGGFDHAAVHRASARLYVAHTANDALDLIDCNTNRFSHSIPNLTGIAGALVSDERNLVFTSNRGENTVGIFSPDDEAGLYRVPVGVHPNGLAYDPKRNRLLAANVGEPAIPDSSTVSVVDVHKRVIIATIRMPGRTRWTIFDAQTDAFYVNVMEPAQIAVIDADEPARVARVFQVPAAGPHGLDVDLENQRLFCACDGKKLFQLDARKGANARDANLAGSPDVIFHNAALNHLYIAIGDPGLVEVFDAKTLKRIETVSTEMGAHTIAFNADKNRVYAFLPQSHRAAIFEDTV